MNIDNITSFMALEPYLQIALPIGFLCYLLARLGINHKDNTAVMVFSSFVFSALSAVGWILTPDPLLYKVLAAILVPFICALLWLKWGEKVISISLRKSGLTNKTQYPDVITEIAANTDMLITSVVVLLKNGDTLRCSHTTKYKDAPIHLMRHDQHGNIAIYVDAIKRNGQTKFKDLSDTTKYPVGNEQYGYKLTYIPASEIVTIKYATEHA